MGLVERKGSLLSTVCSFLSFNAGLFSLMYKLGTKPLGVGWGGGGGMGGGGGREPFPVHQFCLK